VQSLATRLAWFGALNALSMVTLKLTSPGVPDLYQGHELIELTLVDPDNRRPVDFGLRSAWLAEQQALAAHATRAGRPFDLAALTATPTDGRLKLWVTWRLLQLRRERPALFRDGGYAPLAVRCTADDDPVVAFEREAAGERVVVLAARLHARRLAGQPGWPVGPAAWRDAVLELPALADGTRLHDRLSGRMLTVHDGVVRLAEALQALPVAVFEVGRGATAAAGERRD
jgi:(1->4)-alpha-D-glucan 1-alpha-D-glucosylmutase